MVQPGKLETEIKAVGLEPNGFDQGRQGFLQVSEAGENFREPGQGPDVTVGRLGDPGPGRALPRRIA